MSRALTALREMGLRLLAGRSYAILPIPRHLIGAQTTLTAIWSDGHRPPVFGLQCDCPACRADFLSQTADDDQPSIH